MSVCRRYDPVEEVIDHGELGAYCLSDAALSSRYRLLLEASQLQVASELLECLVTG